MAVGLLVAVVGSQAPIGTGARAPVASAASAAPLSLAFNATFGGSSLDRSTWATCYPWFPNPGAGCTNFGNASEQQWYLPSQDQVSNGALHMVANATPTQGTDRSGAPKTYPYTSGMVTTYPSLSFTYGYVQVAARIPGGAGTWPALWLLPQTQLWPPEIDIMENWGSTNTVQTTFHWGTPASPQRAGQVVASASDLTGGWHTYGLLWQPGSLTWYLDDAPVYSHTGSGVPSEPMYFLANLAVDGPAPSGSSFDVQSVQIYQGIGSKPSMATPAPAPVPPPTPAPAPVTAATPECRSGVPGGQSAVAMATTPDDGGYWIATNAGAVADCGNAVDYGEVTTPVNSPVVGMASTPDGRGYWLVASDGGIFSFGNAAFYGSTGAVRLNKPVVGMTPDDATGGYWMVASDGGVFSFNAPFYGSTGNITLARPVVGAAAAPNGAGYRFVASDGGIFNFGTCQMFGSGA